MELLKSTAKFILVTLFAFTFIYTLINDILHLGITEHFESLSKAGELTVKLFVVASLALILIALIDVPFQLYEYNKKLKMSIQEIKDEYKQQEGNPEVKGRIRQVQREMSQRRMMQQVPTADVIITNPTHFAVAISYKPEEMTQPIVVASGTDLMAMQIRNIAKENRVPIIESPALARSLYANTELDQPIPYGLFKAVASILAYTQQLGKDFDGKDLKIFDDLEIPEELRFDAR
jgi:flagellar biosynthetic protein FlhB